MLSHPRCEIGEEREHIEEGKEEEPHLHEVALEPSAMSPTPTRPQFLSFFPATGEHKSRIYFSSFTLNVCALTCY